MQMLKAYAKDFWRYRYLLQNLIGRDFKLKYRRSVLGVVWSVLNPLLMNVVMVVVFSTLFDMRGSGIKNFSVYLIIGRVCFALVNCLFSFIALVIVMLVTGAKLHATVLLAFYPLLTLFVFTLGIGLALAAATVFFRDVMHLWGVFTLALNYFSAIFYDPEQMNPLVVGSVELSLSQVIRFNPLYWYITGFRATVLDGTGLTWSMVWICGLCAVIALAVGLFVFRRQQDKFVLHI